MNLKAREKQKRNRMMRNRGRVQRKKMNYTVRGVTTIEMAYIMPIVLLAFMVILYITFYYHDKNILTGMAHETALIGAQQERTLEGMKEGELTGFFSEHTNGKLILFANPGISISKNKDFVTASVTAQKSHMKLYIEMKASVMEPEKYIRLLRKVK